MKSVILTILALFTLASVASVSMAINYFPPSGNIVFREELIKISTETGLVEWNWCKYGTENLRRNMLYHPEIDFVLCYSDPESNGRGHLWILAKDPRGKGWLAIDPCEGVMTIQERSYLYAPAAFKDGKIATVDQFLVEIMGSIEIDPTRPIPLSRRVIYLNWQIPPLKRDNLF
jgi:hypothetical protein